MSDFIPVEKFGKDHWSTLAYVECCCVDNQPLDKRRLRCNPNTHPVHAVRISGERRWEPAYGTRLKGFFGKVKNDERLRLPDHDDWDCLYDLEAAGLIDLISEANAIVRMTPEGSKVAARIREHKANGGSFANFGEPPAKDAQQ